MASTRAKSPDSRTIVPVVEEQASTRKSQRSTGTVRVRKLVHEEDQPVTTDLQSERIEIERVPRDEFVDGPIPDRQEGETTIISVVEEVTVVEKRLKLIEEVRITRCHLTRPWEDVVTVRRNEVRIERRDLPDDAERE